MMDTEGFTDLAAHPDAGDDRLYVIFKLLPLRNEDKSIEEGRPIFVDTEFVEIRSPGDPTNIILRAASDLDRRRFPRQYANFKAGKAEAIIGTPLAAVPWLTRSQVEELAFFKIRTVEHLAELSDTNAQRFPGIQQLKSKAKDFLAAAAGEAPAEKLRAALAERDSEVQVLKRQIAEAHEAIAEIRKVKKG